MLSALGLSTIFELFLVVAVVWAIFNEDKFIAFEKRVLSAVRRRRLKVVKSSASQPRKVYTR